MALSNLRPQIMRKGNIRYWLFIDEFVDLRNDSLEINYNVFVFFLVELRCDIVGLDEIRNSQTKPGSQVVAAHTFS